MAFHFLSLIKRLTVFAYLIFTFYVKAEEAWKWRCGTTRGPLLSAIFGATTRTQLATGLSGSTPCPTSSPEKWITSPHDLQASLSLLPPATTRYTWTVMIDVISISATRAALKIRCDKIYFFQITVQFTVLKW